MAAYGARTLGMGEVIKERPEEHCVGVMERTNTRKAYKTSPQNRPRGGRGWEVSGKSQWQGVRVESVKN